MKISYPEARKYVLETGAWLMAGAKSLFVSVAAKRTVSCAVETDITWLKGDNPVQPNAPPRKGTQT